MLCLRSPLKFVVLASVGLSLASCGPSSGGGGGGGGGSEPPVYGPISDDVFPNVSFVTSFAAYAAAAQNLVQNDLRYLAQLNEWWFDTGPTYDSYSIESVRAHFAHAAGLTGAGQTIAFIDAGFRQDHEQFSGKTITTIGAPGDVAVDDHGTGVVAIATGNGSTDDMIGIAPGADLILEDYYDEAEMATAVDLARTMGAVAQSNSWAYSGVHANQSDFNSIFGFGDGQTYFNALKAYAAEGVVLFAASNNEGNNNTGLLVGLPILDPTLEAGWLAVINLVPTYNDDGIISVERVSGACLDAAQWCIGADGAWYTADATATDGYDFGTGTSFATPVVAGALALLAEAFDALNGDLSPHQLRNRLLASADNSFLDEFDAYLDFGSGVLHGYNEEFGHGFLDIRAALLPIGGASVTLAGGQVADAERPLILTGTGFGDAVARALEGHDVIATDALSARFAIPGNALAAAALPQPASVRAAALVPSLDLTAVRMNAAAPFTDPAAQGLLQAYDGMALGFDMSGEMGLGVLVPGEQGGGGVSFQRNFDLGVSRLALGASVIEDRGGPLSLSGPQATGESTVAAFDLGFSTPISGRGRLTIDGHFGFADTGTSALFGDLPTVAFNSMGAELAWTSLFQRGDNLALRIAAPPAVTSGQLDLSLPTTLAAGQQQYEAFGIGLAPDARQIDLSLTYRHDLGRGREMFWGLYDSLDAGNRAGTRQQGAVIAFQMRF